MYHDVSWCPAWKTLKCSRHQFLLVFILVSLCIVNVGCWHERIVYSRETLLNIEKAHPKLKSDPLNFRPHLNTNYTWPARARRRRGKRGGLHARLKARATRPPLPSLLLANVRSLENKMDELRARTTTQREIRE